MKPGYHLFALIQTDMIGSTPLPSGLEEGELTLLPAGPVTAVAQLVADDFTARLQQGNMAEAERDWLTAQLLAHERVVEDFAARGPLFPLGFGVLLADPLALQAAISPHTATLSEFFKRAAGRQEWSLKFFIREQAPKRGQMAQAARSGLEYLTARHAVPERMAAQEAVGRTFVEQAVAQLSPFFEDIVSNKTGAAPAKDLRLLANIALLVPESAQTEFVQTIQALVAPADAEGIELTLTGPWPLYSFRPSMTLG